METPAGGQILLPVAAWQEKRAVPGDFLRYPAGPGLETSGNDAMVFPRRSPSFPRTDDTYEALSYGKFVFSHLCKTTEFCPEALARPPGCRGEMHPRRRGVAGVANADRLPSVRVSQAPLPDRSTHAEFPPSAAQYPAALPDCSNPAAARVRNGSGEERTAVPDGSSPRSA